MITSTTRTAKYSYVDASGNKGTLNFKYIAGGMSHNELIDFGQSIFDLTTNTYTGGLTLVTEETIAEDYTQEGDRV